MPSTDKGDYYRPLPLDFLILEVIPERGLIGGIQWKGWRVMDILDNLMEREDIDGSILSTPMIQSRLRSMRIAGYVQSFETTAANGRSVWARSKEGTAHLEKRDEILGL